MGFTKLDERIIQSSIMCESLETFKIWITLLALCRADGVAECSAVYLESVCRIPLDTILKSLEVLMAPDVVSRSINDDGRRIERVDGGYKIINYEKYRSESLKSAEAERKRLYRESKKTDESVQVFLEPCEEAFELARKKYPGTKRGHFTEYSNFMRKCKNYKEVALILIAAINNQTEWREQKRLAGMFVSEWPNFQTWINQRRWEEEKPEIKNSQPKRDDSRFKQF